MPRSLFSGWCPPPHTLHPLAASKCRYPLPRAGGTGWMCATQLYKSAITLRGHKHRCCHYSTLRLSCYHCWTEKCCSIVPWHRKGFTLLLQSSCSTPCLEHFCRPPALEKHSVCLNGSRAKNKECSSALMFEKTIWMCSHQNWFLEVVVNAEEKNQQRQTKACLHVMGCTFNPAADSSTPSWQLLIMCTHSYKCAHKYPCTCCISCASMVAFIYLGNLHMLGTCSSFKITSHPDLKISPFTGNTS